MKNDSLIGIAEFADNLNDMINEVLYLREENKMLKNKLKEYEDFNNRQYENAKKQIGSILNTLVEIENGK